MRLIGILATAMLFINTAWSFDFDRGTGATDIKTIIAENDIELPSISMNINFVFEYQNKDINIDYLIVNTIRYCEKKTK